MMLTEFSGHVQGFLLHSIDRIARVEWSTVHAPDAMLAADSYISAVTQLPDGTLVSVLDVEQVLATIHGEPEVPNLAPAARSDANVFFADDSAVARREIARVLDRLGENADILTVWRGEAPVASVLSLYHRSAVMPYWGGGTRAARALRANDRIYFELMAHARRRGCTRFDFGRSKTGSGPYHFKRNWGFVPEPLTYANWTAPGRQPRDADPTSAKHRALIAAWQMLPLAVANRLGPLIARGLG